jgi:hypothetical protein
VFAKPSITAAEVLVAARTDPLPENKASNWSAENVTALPLGRASKTSLMTAEPIRSEISARHFVVRSPKTSSRRVAPRPASYRKPFSPEHPFPNRIRLISADRISEVKDVTLTLLIGRFRWRMTLTGVANALRHRDDPSVLRLPMTLCRRCYAGVTAVHRSANAARADNRWPPPECPSEKYR